MASKFSRGSRAYTKDGRVYTVEEIEAGMVYCTLPNGTETEFPEAKLLNEEEWAAWSDGRRDSFYSRLRQSLAHTASAIKIDNAAAEELLAQAERVMPSLLDFIAFTAAERILAANKAQALMPELSIVKCRDIFDSVAPDARVNLLADILGLQADVLLSAARLGDNMARAMVERGLSRYGDAFENFGDRPRRVKEPVGFLESACKVYLAATIWPAC